MEIDSLLNRSADFERTIVHCLPDTGTTLAISDDRNELAAASGSFCIEHGHVLRSAFALRAPTSGSALLRIQYEALLRAASLMFAATPAQLAKLASNLDLEAEQPANNLPGYSVMLSAVLKSAPEGLSGALAQFNQYSRHALNSVVHSGLHALHRTRHGYPGEMASTAIRLSNALSLFGYRLLTSMSGTQRRMEKVTRLYHQFIDCLPMQ